MDRRKIIVIPAYNEEESIGAVLDDINRHFPEIDVVVVNDGSLDDTSIIAEGKGAKVLNLPFNVGIGGAVQAGYKFAEAMNYDVAIQVDADGQHLVTEIPKLLNVLEKESVDMVVGSRYLDCKNEDFSIFRRVAKLILSTTISLVVRRKVTDPSSGFRAINRNLIWLFSKLYPRDYPEPEALVFIHCEGFTFREVPVVMKQRETGKSSISASDGLYYVIKVLLAVGIDLFKAKIFRKRGAEQ